MKIKHLISAVSLTLFSTFVNASNFNSPLEESTKRTLPPIEVPSVKPKKEVSYFYLNTGSGVYGKGDLAPVTFGVGYRYAKGHHGFDGSFNLDTFSCSPTITLQAKYLFYLAPNAQFKPYVGVGPNIYFFNGKGTKYTPVALLGFEFPRSKYKLSFTQLEVLRQYVPSWRHHFKRSTSIALSLGWGF